MYRYSAFSLTIDSELELPDLAEGNGDPDVVIRLGRVTRRPPPATIENEFAFLLDIGGFHIKCGREIVVDPLPNTDPRELRLLLQGRLMAYLLRQRGFLPLHSSSVAIAGQGALFVGESGSGKSTTAAAFYARGHDVLADDIGALRIAGAGVELRAAWPVLRLRHDARSLIPQSVSPSSLQEDKEEKYILHLEHPESAGLFPVKRIYFLEFGTDEWLSVRTEFVPRSVAVALLNSHSFLRPWRAGNELRRINLNLSASVAAAVPVHRLIRLQSLDSLPKLVDFVEKDLTANE